MIGKYTLDINPNYELLQTWVDRMNIQEDPTPMLHNFFNQYTTYVLQSRLSEWKNNHHTELKEEVDQVMPLKRDFEHFSETWWGFSIGEIKIPCNELKMMLNVEIFMWYTVKPSCETFEMKVVIYTFNYVLKKHRLNLAIDHQTWDCESDDEILEYMAEPAIIERIRIPTKYRVDTPPENHEQSLNMTRQLLQGLSEQEMRKLRNTAYLRFLQTFRKLHRCSICKIEVQASRRCNACILNTKRAKR